MHVNFEICKDAYRSCAFDLDVWGNVQRASRQLPDRPLLRNFQMFNRLIYNIFFNDLGTWRHESHILLFIIISMTDRKPKINCVYGMRSDFIA